MTKPCLTRPYAWRPWHSRTMADRALPHAPLTAAQVDCILGAASGKAPNQAPAETATGGGVGNQGRSYSGMSSDVEAEMATMGGMQGYPDPSSNPWSTMQPHPSPQALAELLGRGWAPADALVRPLTLARPRMPIPLPTGPVRVLSDWSVLCRAPRGRQVL